MTTSPSIQVTGATYARHRTDTAEWAFHIVLGFASYYVQTAIAGAGAVVTRADRHADLIALRTLRHQPWIHATITLTAVALVVVAVIGFFL